MPLHRVLGLRNIALRIGLVTQTKFVDMQTKLEGRQTREIGWAVCKQGLG